jgi:hypothetical protein
LEDNLKQETEMALTIEAIRAAQNKTVLIELLSAELQRFLPEEVQEDRELYFQVLDSMPRGLRAMAGMYFLDISLTQNRLAWHFGDQNDERDLRETLNGLRELELTEIAESFEKTWKFFEPHMSALQSGDYGDKEFSEWLEEIGALKLTEEMDEKILIHLKKAGRLGLLESWPVYARKYPERCVVAAA